MRTLVLVSLVSLLASLAHAAPVVRELGDRVAVEGAAYRIIFYRDIGDMLIELKTPDGKWQPVTRNVAAVSLSRLGPSGEFSANGSRATWALERVGDAVLVGRQAPLDAATGTVLELHCFCTDEGVLFGARPLLGPGDNGEGCFWSPPRLQLIADDWDSYAFFGPDGKRHEGQIANLQPTPAYAGVSAWGPQGDTVASFDPQQPALIVRSATRGVGLGVVFLDYATAWQGCSGFIQRHQPKVLFLYSGYMPVKGNGLRWAWLAPFAPGDSAADAARARDLLARGEALVAAFKPIAPVVPKEMMQPVPDFPANLRRAEPVRDIADAIIYTMGENNASNYGVTLARKVGTDMVVRGWFKWAQAPQLDNWHHIPVEMHKLGALFGGGITCSALYDNENNLTKEQVLDMATRGPAGQLIDAWDTPGIRHGSLSCPAYLDYLLRWCREQIDAGVDYLFMDEHTAAIGGLEGYDDYSLADFRKYLVEACPQTKGWAADDPRWRSDFDIALTDRAICPTGKISSFDFRAYLRAHKLLENPYVEANRLNNLWWQFRAWRDDRAWHELTDRIRAYARDKGRTVLISANGIAPYVDLQVLGVWGKWVTDSGHISLAENQVAYWRSLVNRGRAVAGKKVPVVVFHDWGFGEPPFPWMAVAPSEREVWMRTRGAEIFAAGGFFAFPVLGPFNCDAGRDGTLRTIARQTAFYKSHADLYLKPRWLGSENLQAEGPVSLAAWWMPETKSVIVHAINRDVQAGALKPRETLAVSLPLSAAPEKAWVISPDFEGEKPATCRIAGNNLEVSLPGLEAYSVAVLQFTAEPDLTRLADPNRVRPEGHWSRPTRNEFRVLPDGSVEHADQIEGFLQGMLHTHLRNPPVFTVNALTEGTLAVHIQAVATAGARLLYRVDDQPAQTVELPDLDGKNDGAAAEYNKTFTFNIPRGKHRLALDNIGGDWAVISWLEFKGKFGE